MSVLAVHLPQFRLERCGYRGDQAVVLLAFEKNADRVQAATPRAAGGGIGAGMTLAEARALVPEVQHERLDAEGEAKDLESLRDALQRFTPAVAAVPPDALLLDAPPRDMMAVRRYLEGLGHTCRLVRAPEAQIALTLARFVSADRVVEAAEVPRVIAPVPVEALGLPRAVLDALADAGIRSAGQFGKLPAAALGSRFGHEVAVLHALVRGDAPPSVVPVLPERTEPVYALDFPDAVETLEPLFFVLHGLVRDLCADLDRAQQAASRVQVRLRLEEGEHLVAVRLGQAMRGADRITKLLRARLERVRIGAPAVAIAVELLEATPWHPPQPSLFDRAQAPEPLPELLARLEDALGAGTVVRPRAVDTWRPEHAVAEVAREIVENKYDPALPHEPALAVRPRPPILLPTARPVRVAVAPSGRPRAMLLDDAWFAIGETEGPERLSGEWWTRAPQDRDYWRVTLADGRRAWIYREAIAAADGQALGLERWYLHGWIDGAASPRPSPGASRHPLPPGGRGDLAVVAPGEAHGAPRPPLPPGGRGDLAVVARSTPSNVVAFPSAASPQPSPGASRHPHPALRATAAPTPGRSLRDRPGTPAPRLPADAPAAPPAASSLRSAQAGRFSGHAPAPARYAELVARSNYSFTEGASFPEELLARAEELGLHALALTDRDGVYGSVRLHRAAKTSKVRAIHGALFTVQLDPGRGARVDEGGPSASVAALVQDLDGWSTLCRLITAARAESPKGRAELPLGTLLADHAGLILLARGTWEDRALHPLRDAVGDRLYRAVSRRLEPGEEARIDARVAGEVPCVATGDVLMHDAARRRLQDVLACIRLGVTLPQAGTRLQPNGERVLAGAGAMARRFAAWPGLVERTIEIASRCRFTMTELKYRYPREVVPDGYAPMQWLRELVRRGLYQRYRGNVPDGVRRQVEHELAIVERLDFPAYFLTVHDVVRFARSRGILCQGRGSAANSAVCWALGVTSVDPAHSSLLFERFISEERGEPPDIDVDFEHERREEVIQYVYDKYGRYRAGMVNEVICYRGRMAMRDVGKAVGLSLDQVDGLAKLMDSWSMKSVDEARLKEAGLDPGDKGVALAVELARQVQGFPRHTSIHVGGFVISDGPLIDRVPIEPATMDARTVIQWDKDDVDELGFVKVDILALGMLTAIRKAFHLVHLAQGVHVDLGTIPREDPAVYAMLQDADSIGVFQVESRAQQGMLPRLKPKNFYDLVVEVSLVRPGPIQGGMVHPYLARRAGKEPVTYADPRLVPVLERTLGVPIFQEQVMAMAVAVGGFTAGEADQLRRAMGAWRKRGGLTELSEKLKRGLEQNGIAAEYAEQIQAQIQGFAEYGFPESHAASFAHLVYVSAWLRCYFPAAMTAGLINAQPMGFYAPRTLVADAQRHGVEVRPVDVRSSDWDCTLEPGLDGPALRLGLRLVRGLGEEPARALVAARRTRAFEDLADLAARSSMKKAELRKLARADALGGLARGTPAPRREAAWAVEGLWPGMFAGVRRVEGPAEIPVATAVDEVQADYLATGLSIDRHPIGLVRAKLDRDGVVPLARLIEIEDGTSVRIAGLVGIRQRPDTASGVIFLMLEDETGTANVVVWPKLYERQRTTIRTERLLTIQGTLQRQEGAISVVAKRVAALRVAPDVQAKSRDFR